MLNHDGLSRVYDDKCRMQLSNLVKMLGSKVASTISVYMDEKIKIKDVEFPATMSTTITDKAEYQKLREVFCEFIDRFVGPTPTGEDACELEIYVFSNPTPDEGTVPLIVSSPLDSAVSAMSGDSGQTKEVNNAAEETDERSEEPKEVEHVDTRQVTFTASQIFDTMRDIYRRMSKYDPAGNIAMVLMLRQYFAMCAISDSGGKITKVDESCFKNYAKNHYSSISAELLALDEIYKAAINDCGSARAVDAITYFATHAMQSIVRYIRL